MDEALSLGPAPFGRAALLLVHGQIAVARGDQETTARIVAELGSLPGGAEAGAHRTLPAAGLEIDCRLAEGDLDGAVVLKGQ